MPVGVTSRHHRAIAGVATSSRRSCCVWMEGDSHRCVNLAEDGVRAGAIPVNAGLPALDIEQLGVAHLLATSDRLSGAFRAFPWLVGPLRWHNYPAFCSAVLPNLACVSPPSSLDRSAYKTGMRQKETLAMPSNSLLVLANHQQSTAGCSIAGLARRARWGPRGTTGSRLFCTRGESNDETHVVSPRNGAVGGRAGRRADVGCGDGGAGRSE